MRDDGWRDSDLVTVTPTGDERNAIVGAEDELEQAFYSQSVDAVDFTEEEMLDDLLRANRSRRRAVGAVLAVVVLGGGGLLFARSSHAPAATLTGDAVASVPRPSPPPPAPPPVMAIATPPAPASPPAQAPEPAEARPDRAPARHSIARGRTQKATSRGARKTTAPRLSREGTVNPFGQ